MIRLPALLILLLSARAHAQSSERLGPVRADFEGGHVRVGGLLQLSSELASSDTGLDGFVRFRRARLDLRSSFVDTVVGARAHLSLTARNPELLDLYLDVAPHELARVRLGIAKTPFTAYRQQSINNHLFVDWPVVSRWFGGERQLGALVHGESSGIGYAIGVYNGDPSRPQNHRFSQAYGESAPTRSTFGDSEPYDAPHPEIIGRAGIERGPLMGSLSAAWDVRPVHGIDTSARFALEGKLDTELLDVWLIGYLATSETIAGRPMLSLGGSLVEAQLTLHPRVMVGLRYAAVLLTKDLQRDVQQTPTAPTSARRALHELTAGITIFAVGHSLKWQTDVSWLHDNRDDIRLRLQAQLAF